MTTTILTTFKQQVAGLKLIPAGGGCFELSANGELLYSKLQTGQFPEEDRIVAALRERITKAG